MALEGQSPSPDGYDSPRLNVPPFLSLLLDSFDTPKLGEWDVEVESAVQGFFLSEIALPHA